MEGYCSVCYKKLPSPPTPTAATTTTSVRTKSQSTASNIKSAQSGKKVTKKPTSSAPLKQSPFPNGTTAPIKASPFPNATPPASQTPSFPPSRSVNERSQRAVPHHQQPLQETRHQPPQPSAPSPIASVLPSVTKTVPLLPKGDATARSSRAANDHAFVSHTEKLSTPFSLPSSGTERTAPEEDDWNSVPRLPHFFLSHTYFSLAPIQASCREDFRRFSTLLSRIFRLPAPPRLLLRTPLQSGLPSTSSVLSSSR